MTHHTQIRFELANGKKVKVDQRLYAVLTYLRDLGVKTQYSCEGDPSYDEVGLSAYILADRKSFRPIIKEIKKFRKRKNVPAYLRRFSQDFLDGYISREYEVWIRHENAKSKVFGKKIYRGEETLNGFQIQYITSYPYGIRTVIRFPHEQIALMEQLLIHLINER